jgi:hypothetical protein
VAVVADSGVVDEDLEGLARQASREVSSGFRVCDVERHDALFELLELSG